MRGKSNTATAVLSFIMFLLSIPVLVGGIWLSLRASGECVRYLDKALIVVGVFLMVLSMAGVVGSFCMVTWLLWLYLFLMLLVILLAFVVTSLLITTKGTGKAVRGAAFQEYNLSDYSDWLKDRVNDQDNWLRIKSCLQTGGACKNLQESNHTWNQFLRNHLSPIESGCCKPPWECGFRYENGTYWIPEYTVGLVQEKPDCKAWSNDQKELCYDCQSCKAGVLANLKKSWKKVAVWNMVFLLFLLLVYSTGCWAIRNNRRQGKLDDRMAIRSDVTYVRASLD